MNIINSIQSTNNYIFRKFGNDISYQADLSNAQESKQLTKGQKTLIPNNSQLILGNLYTLNLRNPNLKSMLEQKQKILIGTTPHSNIPVNDFYSDVDRQHLILEKSKDGIIAQDISNDSKTSIIPRCRITSFLTGCQNITMAQQNIGDCYLLASIYSLSHTPKGQNILKDMVKIDTAGNYIVMFKNQRPIIVKPDELDGETYKNGTVKHCVLGDLSLRAIERAYAKLIKTPLNIANLQQLNRGGFPQIAILALTGLPTKITPISKDIDNCLSDIERQGTENTILMCSTPSKKIYGEYMDSDKKFITSHAYAIKSINSKNRTIEIVNPHNTRISETISFDKFKETFDFLYCTEI